MSGKVVVQAGEKVSEVTLLLVGRDRSTAHVSDSPLHVELIPTPPSHFNDKSLEESFLIEWTNPHTHIH